MASWTLPAAPCARRPRGAPTRERGVLRELDRGGRPSSIAADGIALQRDAEGAAFFQAPDGQHVGLRVWAKRPVVSNPDPVNAPGAIRRLNQHRQWRRWSVSPPPFMRGDDIAWDMTFDADERSLEPFRKGRRSPVKASLDQLTKEDEHAI